MVVSPAAPDFVERDLLRAVQDGDEGQFQELVRRYSKLVLSTALRLTKDQGEAEDVAQDTFWRVYRKIGSYDPARPFTPWLYRITLNAAYSRLKKRAGRRESSIEELQPRFDPASGQVSEEPAAVPDFEERFAKREMADLAEQFISELPEDYGTVVWMHDVAGISASVLTDVLRLKLPAFKSRLHRGRLAVRKRLLESLAPAQKRTSEEMPNPMRQRMGITCREVIDGLLHDYFAERLNPEDRERFEQHIHGCMRCGPFVENYRQLVQGLGRMPEPALPREMVEATLAFVRESLEKGRTLDRNWADGLSSAFGRRFRRFLRRR
jgi:RNA polymerase sigma-70 factor (ECF subfamily)